ncbi:MULTISPECIES: L,D-transpeptidase [unclassified Rhizobium]|uniref:L,D-transpeptidase n=1 Tax=unclassified Rhizobium TaxID=2613769 RepID=UPI0009E7E9AD|nr:MULTISPECIES: L,D-transpeptidase [unclassified Rhizobium]
MSEACLNRRFIVLGGAAVVVSAATGCSTTIPSSGRSSVPLRVPSVYDTMYAAMPDEAFPLPAIPYQRIDPRYLRQLVDDPTGERPGTLVVDTNQHFLYLVYEGDKAIRYGVGLGRAGFGWSGEGVIQYKREWPTWTPPQEMIMRQPELAPYSARNGGMPPGLMNPLGARALYIFRNGRDTLYRVHGSPEWWTIGKSVSSGCVRMMNQDIVDLYSRVPPGTPIKVRALPSGLETSLASSMI